MEFRPTLGGPCKTQPYLFQSLFFWIWNSDFCLQGLDQTRTVVSILVFLDMEFRQIRFFSNGPLFFGFNPCFSGCRMIRYWIVSILVFLDMEFRQDLVEIEDQFNICFNPCFSGYGIQTLLQHTQIGDY